MTTHTQARQLAQTALERRFGSNIAPNEVRALAGIGWLEGNYGDAWPGTNNIGAIQADQHWGGATFTHKDTHPNPDGTSTTYVTRFKRYPTVAEGWFDLADTAYSRDRIDARAAARAGNWAEVSRVLFKTGYYEGFGKTEAERIANHAKALTNAISAADAATGTPADTSDVELPVQVIDPQGTLIGSAVLSDAVAPGSIVLARSIGTPSMVAYPNGWRFALYPDGTQIPVVPHHAYEPLATAKAPGFTLGHAGLVLAGAGVALTVLLEVRRRKGRRHARAA